jgi:NADH-quinone oxidoreductase subunit J
MLLVIVYVGAVAVLFLFVVMMLDIDFAELRAGFMKNFPLGIAIAMVLLAELVLGIGAYKAGALELGTPDGSARRCSGRSNIESIGALLYGKYLFLFETAGIILLVAMVGAIVLTHRGRAGARAGSRTSPSRSRASRDEATGQQASLKSGQGVSCDRHRTLRRRQLDPVRARRARHLPQPQERDRHPDGDRADPARGEHQPRRLQRLPRRPDRARIFAMFVLTVAAGEAAIGSRSSSSTSAARGTIAVDDVNRMKGLIACIRS